jgi:uncharacterized membrane protein YeaQ/YmgE (transglycosylase-associated protein family)
MEIMVLAAISSSVNWIGWIIIGAIAGALAGRVIRGRGFGILVDIIVGILGALLGGFLLGLVVTADIGIIWSFVVAFLGACLLIWIVRLFEGSNRRRGYSRR